jgi:hypothetical protein
MPIMLDRYGARPLDEVTYQYHAFELHDLDMLAPGMEEAVDLAVEKALKKLGVGWELDHVITGAPFQLAGGKASWPHLFFRKRK